MKTPAFFAAAILALAATATPTLSMPHQGADMLRTSLANSVRSIWVSAPDIDSLTLPQLVRLKGIVDSGDSEGTKAFRARTLLEQAGG
jgi:hypothetical protein